MKRNLRPTNLIERIYNDIATGSISARTPMHELSRRYGRGPNPESCWLEYKLALRAYGADHGTMVIFDETRDIFIAAMDCASETTKEEVIAQFDPLVRQHIRDFGGARTKVTIYRLPRGDYSDEKFAFFEDRAEYLWEATGGRDPVPA